MAQILTPQDDKFAQSQIKNMRMSYVYAKRPKPTHFASLDDKVLYSLFLESKVVESKYFIELLQEVHIRISKELGIKPIMVVEEINKNSTSSMVFSSENKKYGSNINVNDYKSRLKNGIGKDCVGLTALRDIIHETRHSFQMSNVIKYCTGKGSEIGDADMFVALNMIVDQTDQTMMKYSVNECLAKVFNRLFLEDKTQTREINYSRYYSDPFELDAELFAIDKVSELVKTGVINKSEHNAEFLSNVYGQVVGEFAMISYIKSSEGHLILEKSEMGKAKDEYLNILGENFENRLQYYAKTSDIAKQVCLDYDAKMKDAFLSNMERYYQKFISGYMDIYNTFFDDLEQYKDDLKKYPAEHDDLEQDL